MATKPLKHEVRRVICLIALDSTASAKLLKAQNTYEELDCLFADAGATNCYVALSDRQFWFEAADTSSADRFTKWLSKKLKEIKL